MAVTTFAAIDIGSYEISMKIFEFSKKIGFRELNDVRYRLEIGKGAYSRGRLEPEMVDDICVILKDFSNMMQEFGRSRKGGNSRNAGGSSPRRNTAAR